MNEINLILIVIAFFISLISVFIVIKKNFEKGIVGKNINVLGEPLIAESTGIALLIPLWILILLSSVLYGFNVLLIAVAVAVSIFGIIGFLDDNKNKFLTNALGWQIRALPMALTSLGIATILFFPSNVFDFLWIIIFALFFAGIASFSNTFEGLNGWTVGSSFIISIFASLVAYQISIFISFLYIMFAGIILGLLMFNKFPAKTFPGDSGTLFIGSGIAGLALLTGNIYFIIFIFLLFIPHIIDFFLLKVLTNYGDVSQQKMRPYKLIKKGKDKGKLTIPDYKGKTKYDFAKLVMKIFGPLEEWKVVFIIWCVVIINSMIWATIFGGIIF